MVREFDYVIFGAGIYGLYAAKLLGELGRRVQVIEIDAKPFQRASYVNQARVHHGYHYPRSVSTAMKSAHYFSRFNEEFEFAINNKFRNIYAVSLHDSMTNAEQFLEFCAHVGIAAEEVNPGRYFNQGMVEAAFQMDEYTYDAIKVKQSLLDRLHQLKHVEILYHTHLQDVQVIGEKYSIQLNNGLNLLAPHVINATYASVNQLLNSFGYELFKTKYELCEVILTKISTKFDDVGITVMDGPFFSMMPFGHSGTHSLTSVSDTPHETSNGSFPVFPCQHLRADCNESVLQNCNFCSLQPPTAWKRMKQLAKKYLNSEIEISYQSSLFTVKTTLSTAELDDSRPTVVKVSSEKPTFISVLSGKMNSIYDLEEVLL